MAGNDFSLFVGEDGRIREGEGVAVIIEACCGTGLSSERFRNERLFTSDGPRSVPVAPSPWQPAQIPAYCFGPFCAEAVHTKREDPVPDGRVDHLWIRVRDPAASKRFYMTIGPHAGLRIGVDKPDHVQMVGENFSFSLIDDERPLTEHVHLAFPAQDDATVRAFHAAALAAGYEDHGGPGERSIYHPGYYAAFVLDPDGHNVEVVNHNR